MSSTQRVERVSDKIFRASFPERHNADHGHIKVVESQHAVWTETYERKRAVLWPIVHAISHGLHHTGSTSVPDLPAKPIVDMMLEVEDVEAFDALRPELEAVGYIWCGETMPGCRYAYGYKEGIGVISHLHVSLPGSARCRSVLAFRDALRDSEPFRQEYTSLKRSLLRVVDEDDRVAYSQGKSDFVQRVLQSAGVTTAVLGEKPATAAAASAAAASAAAAAAKVTAASSRDDERLEAKDERWKELQAKLAEDEESVESRQEGAEGEAGVDRGAGHERKSSASTRTDVTVGK